MKALLTVIVCLYSFALFAQGKTYVREGELQIGEQTELVYEFPFSGKAESIQFQPYTKVIPCHRRSELSSVNSGTVELEIIGDFKDTIITKQGYKLWQGTYKITVWDTGYLIIPPASLIYEDSIIDFMPALLTVTMPKTEAGKDIYDIKENFVEIEPEYFTWLKNYWWLLLIGLGTIIGLVWFIRRNNRPKPKVEKILNLKDRSLLAINALEKARFWERGQVKEHYIELSFIFRSYLGARYNINLLERTSYETGFLLGQLNLSPDTVQTIKTILDYSDMVKFAKATPTEFDILKNLAQVRQIIAETSPLEIEPHAD